MSDGPLAGRLRMERAIDLFDIHRRAPESAFVDETWWTRSTRGGSFISVAVAHWHVVVTTRRGATRLTVRGPETKATTVPIPDDAEFFGINFSLGTFMPTLEPRDLVDRALTLPPASSTSFVLDGSAWELPNRHNADVFVDRLVRAGRLLHDPLPLAALHGDAGGLSTRSVERRLSHVTGLTSGVIRQIRRAERAVELLSAGVPAAEAARRAGFADQPHMGRSLKRFVGLTPSQIARSSAARHGTA
jgi:AraC-like DNA-binding protein